MRSQLMRMWSGRAGRWARGVTAGLVALAVAGHVSSTILVNTPNNPVRQQAAPIVGAYFSPVFNQDWRLFAPNPVDTDRGLLVQATLPSGQVTGYADVTSPEIAGQVHDPFPDRSAREVTRGAGNLMSAITRVRAELGAPARAEFDDRQLARVAPTTRDQYLSTRDVVVDVARWQARALWGPSVTRVRVRLVSYTYPRFSERDADAATGPGALSQIELPWWPAGEGNAR